MAGFQIALCNAHYLRYPLDRFLDSQQKLGRTKIALYGSVPHLLIDHYDYQEAGMLGKRLKQKGFEVDALIPAAYGYSLFAEQGTDHYVSSRDYYCNCVRACRDLGTDVICIRPYYGMLSQKKDILMDSCEQMMKVILKTAKEEGVRVALGTNREQDTAALQTLTSLRAFISKMADSHLGALLDTHIMSMADETIDDWITGFGKALFYVHMADGRKGGYSIWGKGVHPMEAFVESLRQHDYEGSCTYLLMGDAGIPEQADILNHQAAVAAGEEIRC